MPPPICLPVMPAYEEPQPECSSLLPYLKYSQGVKFIWGEVKELNGDRKTATIKTMFSNNMDEIGFDYCIICSGP